MPQKHHEQAAQHNEEAAKHHRKAAKQASEGNHEKSAYHAQMAHGNQVKAKEHANEASKKHVENSMNRMGGREDEDRQNDLAGNSKTNSGSENRQTSKK
jgi:hypothetical protein